jgi:hypothetical protein
MKHLLLGSLAAIPLVSSCSSPSNEPPVIDAASAVALAKKSWPKIYDKTRNPTFSQESTEKFEPYIAELNNGVWTVRASMPEGHSGEALETTIRQQDGTVSVKTVQVK